MIRRRGQEAEEDSSSEEEDAFTALSRKKGKGAKRKKIDSGPSAAPASSLPPKKSNVILSTNPFMESSSADPKVAAAKTATLPVAVTSSMKRHHKPNDTRKAKMDALLLELEIEKGKQKNRDPNRFIPEKKGSFVQPGEEKLTSNLFVGNLAPSVAEEDLSNLFSQFGDLFSIKIMWPRTPEERNRGRNTGFVCFVNREDAEDAIESCNETDPFNVGRLLTLRWGKNVKRGDSGRGPGLRPECSVPHLANAQHSGRAQNQGAPAAVPDFVEREIKELAGTLRPDGLPNVIMLGGSQRQDSTAAKAYDPKIHAAGAIRVEVPTDSSRFQFISRVASYVAKDGMDMERRLWEEEKGNPLFSFLILDNADGEQRKENIFYRWRVYSFCQGDTFSIWRTEPFVMFHPDGRYWIPPPMDEEAANRERARKMNEHKNIRLQDKTDRSGSSRDMLTGRQIERARHLRRRGRGNHRENPSKLSSEERHEFCQLVGKDLSISREKICQAMAFCFDKCLAAQDISGLLKEALTEDSSVVTIDMRVARLYLLSDILFNSQQPGIRNAFMYRSTIESMAPDVFRSLGKYGELNVGRLKMNKLRNAVSCVLGAWTEWGVYNSTFMDELEAYFEGKELKRTPAEASSNQKEGENGDTEGIVPESSTAVPVQSTIESREELDQVQTLEFRGEWTHVVNAPGNEKDNPDSAERGAVPENGTDVDGGPMENSTDALDGEDIDGEDIDGEDLDGEACDLDDMGGQLVNDNSAGSKPGEPDVDGESIDVEGIDLDGEELDVGI